MTADFGQLIDKFSKIRILVIGDVMLDTFIYGDVGRISPESPVPVLHRKDMTHMPGGAGNVASNLIALGAHTDLIGVTGKDDAGDTLITLLKETGIDIGGMIHDPNRPTISKTRFVAQGQQMLRLDEEEITPVSEEIEKALCAQIKKHGKKSDLIILSDYAKGVLTRSVIEAAIQSGKPVFVDSKDKDFSRYKGAALITPNRKELSETSDMPCISDQDIEQAGMKVMREYNLPALIVTRSEDGMSVFESSKTPVHIKAQARDIYDVSGAGDTVMATLGAASAAGASLEQAATLANLAAGIAVTRLGTSVVSADDLKTHLQTGRRAGSTIAARQDVDEATRTIKDWQSQNLKVGFTNGCFDILHHGHVSYLDRARARCDKLVLALNHDASVRILKGPDRPINDQDARASVTGALASVDLVVFFGAEKDEQDNTPCGILETLRPDVIFKGGDYTEDRLPEAKVVRAYGGEVDIMPLYEGYSTTGTIEKLQDTNKGDKAA